MTGNTVIFAISLYADLKRAYLPLTLIALFFIGAILGRAVTERFKAHTALYAEAGLLCAASFAPGYAPLPIMSLAMGMQNTALGTFAGVAANTSFLSGDYTKLAQAIAHVMIGRGRDRDRRTMSIIWPLVVAYVFGALVSVFGAKIPLRLLFVVPVVLALAIATHRKILNPS